MISDLIAALDIAILLAAGTSTLLLCLLLLRPVTQRPDCGGSMCFGSHCTAQIGPQGGRRRRLRATPRTLRAARRFREMLSRTGTKGYDVVAAPDVAAASGA